MRENDAKRSHKRREGRALNVLAGQAVKDFSIAKGGRCGRRELEQVIQALSEGDINSTWEVLRNFDQVPQLPSAYLLIPIVNQLTEYLERVKLPQASYLRKVGEQFSEAFGVGK